MWTYNTILILLGTGLIGACSGLVGTFAVLRQRSLTADALAHATLPGLCLALVLTGYRSQGVLMIGAAIVSLIAVWFISWLPRYTKTKPDAVIGIVLSVFFGAGVALNRMIQSTTAVGKAGLSSFLFGKASGMLMEDVIIIASIAFIGVTLVILFYKEFLGLTFQSEYLKSQGWPVHFLDYLMMGLLAATVVVSLPIVGVVLSSALIIIPASTANLWTNRFVVLLTLSSIIGAISGIAGSMISATLETPTGAMIILFAGSLFIISFLVAPGKGLFSAWLSGNSQTQSWKLRQFLFDLLEAWKGQHQGPLPEHKLPMANRASQLGYLTISDSSAQLTPQGIELATEMDRRITLAKSALDAQPLLDIDFFELMTNDAYAESLTRESSPRKAEAAI
ncbi:metal ABC transporter permease [Lacunimicrobium album]